MHLRAQRPTGTPPILPPAPCQAILFVVFLPADRRSAGTGSREGAKPRSGR